MLFLLILTILVKAEDDDYVEDLNPSRFKIFGPFRDPPVRIAVTTTEDPFVNNETPSTSNQTRDEFILGESTSIDNNPIAAGFAATQVPLNNNCQFACQPIQCSIPQPCTCAAPRPVCIPRPPPLCPPPPILVCPPPQCPKPAQCPPCIQIPALPAPCICPPVYQPPAQNDCCYNCNVPCKTRKIAAFGTKQKQFDEQNLSRCNSQQLRQIIADNISSDLESTKHRIIAAAKQLMDSLNVICGHGEFSYVVQTQLYCQYSVGHTTCYAFKSI